MNIIIKKGRRRSWPPWLGLFFKPQAIQRFVVFLDPSYWIEGEDMADTNKLFGIGYFWSHHTESARVGWRWDHEKKRVVLSAYCYIGKERKIEELATLAIDQGAHISIYITALYYHFSVMSNGDKIGEAWVTHNHRKKWGYLLGPYFGGNKPAPKEIRIQLKKN